MIYQFRYVPTYFTAQKNTVDINLNFSNCVLFEYPRQNPKSLCTTASFHNTLSPYANIIYVLL